MCNTETTPIINKSPHNKSPQDGLDTNVRPQIMKQREGKPQRKCLRTLVWARLSQTGPQKHRIQRQKLKKSQLRECSTRGEVTCRMGENICKPLIWKGINNQNTQGTAKSQQQNPPIRTYPRAADIAQLVVFSYHSRGAGFKSPQWITWTWRCTSVTLAFRR